MIVDTFENAEKYFTLHKNFKDVFEYIFSNDLKLFPAGKYEIIKDEVYLSIDEYSTKLKSRPEYHKNFIDIQFLLSGEEQIGYCPINQLKKDEFFDTEKDIGFGTGNVDFITMTKDKFVILYPTDAHQPCMTIDNPSIVKKVVVKVKIA